jgi:dienelactone hydrolase
VEVGVAIDRSQIGQFPIVVNVPSGRSSAGFDYLVYVPDGYYRSLRRWPLILTLHGGGEVGDDLDRVRGQGLPLRVEEKGGLPFVIVAPQSPGLGWDVGALAALLVEVLEQYRVDADRVYLVGQSMGGTGTWALAASCPERFAAIAPICGGGDPTSAWRLGNLATWAFLGSDDRIVPLERSERMIAALKQARGDARLTVYPGVGHDAWTRNYADPKFYEWLLQHRRGLIRHATSDVTDARKRAGSQRRPRPRSLPRSPATEIDLIPWSLDTEEPLVERLLTDHHRAPRARTVPGLPTTPTRRASEGASDFTSDT